MKFLLTFCVAALVAVASAAPSSPSVGTRDVETPDSAQLCIHIRDCVEALAPTVKACAQAARDRGKSLREDADCLREALDASVTVPDACKSCMAD
ncbi:hypothetical protein SBRCBS47491_001893 [Sporothrix bragantina]|uniref:Fungal calcium binding protein domain-containing protein n=1 Tax=Sporothrix bragantina TaxID=671064 RepID=A0ABP0B357_9PEZI